MTTTTKAPAKTNRKRTPVPESTPQPAISDKTAAALLGDHAIADAGRVYFLNPTTLTLDENARKDVGMTAEFAADVAARGVAVPLLAYRDAVGQLLVWDGQRRLVAAIEGNLDTVPVVITESFGDSEDRLTAQDRVNHHRAALTTVDQLGVYEQLSLMGRPAESIAKKLRRPESEVTAALAVAESRHAREAAALDGVTLQQAAIIAEFDGDVEAVRQLSRILVERPENLEHAAQQIRNDRARETALAAKVAELEAAGVRLVQVSWGDRKQALLDGLAATPGGPVLTPEEHADCPGHCASVSAGYGRDLEVRWFCDQWRKAGHVDRYAGKEQQASQADPEVAREERRRVRSCNQMSTDSTEVRRRWVIDLLQRTTLPKDSPQAAAELMVQTRADAYGSHEVRDLLLGSKQHTAKQLGQSPTAAIAWLLAEAFSRVEESMYGSNGRDYWRRPDAARSAYLRRLKDWGYNLSTLEAAYLAGKVNKL